MLPTNASIFSYLNTKHSGEWQVKNATPIEFANESRASLYVELTIGDKTVIGCSSTDKDFSRDINSYLLEHAVRNAYNNMFAPAIASSPFTEEQINFMRSYAKKHNIRTNEEWDSHIQVWNKDLTKSKLNKDNIEGFIKFAKDLEANEISAKGLE